MVTGLFLLALVSFAAMGLFVVGLTVYSNLRVRAERADLARDALVALFSSRQHLVPDLEALARESGAPRGIDQSPRLEPPTAPVVDDASVQLEQWAAFERAFRVFASEVVAQSARQQAGSPQLAELQRRLADTERAIGDALRAYNSAATEFNDARALVPAAFVARASGLGERRLLVLTH